MRMNSGRLRCPLDYSMFRNTCNSSSHQNHCSAESTIIAEPSPSSSSSSSASSSSSSSSSSSISLSEPMMCSREIREYDFLRCIEESSARSVAMDADVDCTLHLGTGRSPAEPMRSREAATSQPTWHGGAAAAAPRGGATSQQRPVLSSVCRQWTQQQSTQAPCERGLRQQAAPRGGGGGGATPSRAPGIFFTREARTAAPRGAAAGAAAFPWAARHRDHMLSVLGGFPTLPPINFSSPAPMQPVPAVRDGAPNPGPTQPAANTSNFVIRICAQCKTMRTPLWRNGPQGPKSLCNACGIRYKKEERRAAAAAATTSSTDNTASASASAAVMTSHEKCQPSDVIAAAHHHQGPRFSGASWPPPTPQAEKRPKLGHSLRL